MCVGLHNLNLFFVHIQHIHTFIYIYTHTHTTYIDKLSSYVLFDLSDEHNCTQYADKRE